MVCTVVFIADLQTCFNGTLYLLIYTTLLSFFPYVSGEPFLLLLSFELCSPCYSCGLCYLICLLLGASFSSCAIGYIFHWYTIPSSYGVHFFLSHQQSFDPHQLCCFRLIRLDDTCYFNHILIYQHLLHTI